MNEAHINLANRVVALGVGERSGIKMPSGGPVYLMPLAIFSAREFVCDLQVARALIEGLRSNHLLGWIKAARISRRMESGNNTLREIIEDCVVAAEA